MISGLIYEGKMNCGSTVQLAMDIETTVRNAMGEGSFRSKDAQTTIAEKCFPQSNCLISTNQGCHPSPGGPSIRVLGS